MSLDKTHQVKFVVVFYKDTQAAPTHCKYNKTLLCLHVN